MFPLFRLIAGLGLVVVLGGEALAADSAGRVVGVLTDQHGAIVQGAKIGVKNLASNLTQSTVTDYQGRYVFYPLPTGRYQVSATSPGFDPAIRNEVRVTAEQDTVVDLLLSLAPEETVVVVTAPVMNKPLVVETDPRAPRQPIPAHDGADYLKAIPGFSIIRKGGTDGDPVLRGMAGSRLNVLLDGQQILGGCGGRMDPPTAYVYPSAYDSIRVLKGPQTVLYGSGASAGAVLFERGVERVEAADFKLNSALTLGSYGRHDEVIDARVILPSFYAQGVGTRSHTDDYSDGGGAAVHSAYTRWSNNLALGWTPGENTLLELSAAKSDGWAAYADRGMDGTSFARDNVALRFERRQLTSRIAKVEAQAYYNYIDHVMDNFSLRTPGTSFSVSNPDRQTTGGRAAATLLVAARTTLVAGVDTQRNVHTFRGASGKSSAGLAESTYLASPRAEDMRFSQVGFFGEATQSLTPRTRLIGGFREDRHEALDQRACVGATMCPTGSPYQNDTKGATDRRWLTSGFGRLERDLAAGGIGTLYAGVGHVERFPDYWERLRQSPTTLKSAFLSTRPEKTTQLDTGVLWGGNSWSGSLSAFYGKVQDYILIRWSPTPALTRNVDATTMGGEASFAYRLARSLKTDVTLAYVRANNQSDGKPLAQQPPLETRLGVNYENRTVSFGALARVTGRQDRVDIGSGNIVANGMDIGPTGGFAIFSFNGAYRPRRSLLFTGGVDNLLNRAYAEHISRAGAMVPGFIQTTRINEPGRTFWLKVNFDVD
jgi:iron complex outermembrane recepter protein